MIFPGHSVYRVFEMILPCRTGFIHFNFQLVEKLKHVQTFQLKVQSCKLYNNKYMIASIQITDTEIFAFIAVLVFKLLKHKVLFINRKDNRNC